MANSNRAALLATSLGMLTVTLDSSALAVASTAIGRSFHGSIADLQWVSNAFVLAYAGGILSAGRFTDRFGPRTMLRSGVALLAASSMLCMLAPSLSFLAAARLLQGLSGAILVTAGYSLITHVFGVGAERARAFATMHVLGTVGLSGGPVVGGLLTQYFGWRSVFAINVVVAVVVYVLGRGFRDFHDSEALSFDIPGQLLSVVMLSALAVGLIEGGANGFVGWPGIAIVIAVVTFVGFLYTERTAKAPMLPLSIFRNRSFSAGVAVIALWRGSLYGLLFFLGLYFQHTLGYGSAKAGLALLPVTAGPFLSNMLSARLIEWFGIRKVLATGWTISAAGIALLLIVSDSTPYVLTGVGLFLYCVGAGATVPVIGNVALVKVSRSHIGVASGVYNSGGQSGILVGIAVVGGFADQTGVSGLHFAAAAVVIAIVSALILSDRYLSRATPQPTAA